MDEPDDDIDFSSVMVAGTGVEPAAAGIWARPVHQHSPHNFGVNGGIEPTSSGWKPEALPLDDARIILVAKERFELSRP